MMDYFSGTGTEEGLSLQEMIECDMRNAMKYENQMNESLGLKSLDGLNAMPMDFCEEPTAESGLGLKSNLNLADLSWLQTVSVSQVMSPAENTDPNLLVDPQTGMPIGSLPSPTVPVTSAVTVSCQSQQTLNQVNTNAMNTSRIQNGLIQRTHGHFVAIPTSTINSIPSTTSQNFVRQQAPTSPSLRQHLQTVHHQHRNLPSPNTHVVYQNGTTQSGLNSPQPATPTKTHKHIDSREKIYPKPVYSYSCLIAMALKNSEAGCLPVSEIYNFMTGHFPYFKTAPDGWKNSVRHNLSLNKCFEKIENPKSNGNTKKGCLWGMNPMKIEKMDEEIIKWRKKDPIAIKRSMANPEVLEAIERGTHGNPGGRSPAPTRTLNGALSTPSTPTSNNNNNITKVVSSLPSTTTALTTAVNNLSSITSINGNINVIQLKTEPSVSVQTDQSKATDEVIYNNLTTDDLSILDNSLTLDPALSDLALQTGFFDDLANDDFSLEDLQSSSSPLSFSFTTNGLSSSPLTIQTTAAVSGVKEEKVDLSSLGNPNRINRSVTPTANGTTPSGTYLLSRTVSAFT